ncbi:MAG: hypothetical protein AAF560_08315 [Acidobacteriota bacterium]
MSGLSLTIAGVRFEAEHSATLRLIERDSIYQPFLEGRGDFDQRFEVAITVEPAPAQGGLPVLFDTEETWTAFEDSGDVILRMRSVAGDSDYLWVVRLVGGISSQFERVVIHCGTRLIENSGRPIELTNPLHYPLDQLLLMFHLPALPGVLIHAAGLARAGKGVFCAGVSGAGKTTFMRLCSGRIDLEGLSDDRVVVRQLGDRLAIYGTPWAGEGRVGANCKAEPTAVMFLHQAQRNELRQISPSHALQQLLATVSIPWFDKARSEAALAFCQRLVERLPCYELHFRPEPAAVELLDAVL